MERKNMSPTQEQIFKCFLYLPEKILSYHGRENMTEFVLHALCSQNCLNLSKAAYFIDNSDFDCLKGIAGFNKDEAYHQDIWNEAEAFSEHMKKCLFNQKVRNLVIPSPSRAKSQSNSAVQVIANQLNITNPLFYTWTIKYNNQAIFIFESLDHNYDEVRQDLLRVICLLGFCPVF